MKRIELDLSKPGYSEPHKGHNRWHPDIPPALRVDQGEEVVMDARDGIDMQITPESRAADVPNLDFSRNHPMTGPIYVDGAQPGDLLEVTVLAVDPAPFGCTPIVPGFGLLRDYFPDPFLLKWDIADGYATSPDLPGVRILGAPFMGVMGVAPSRHLLEEITRREGELLHRGGKVMPPEPRGAVPNSEPIASEGLRTIPPRENGGNMDTKQMTAGARVLFPVFVEGALFSAGDGHFAQGDGESCGCAIEMCATLHASFKVRKGEAERNNIRFPIFERDDYFTVPEMAVPRRFIATTGLPLSEGRNESEDATLATQHALLNMIDLLMARGWTREQAYCICSVAVDLKLSEMVDIPNCLVSAFLPLDIFDPS